MTRKPAPRRVGMISLGCPKNLVDGEVMLGSLVREGFELTREPAEAEVLVVNTCGFIEPAKQESIDAILDAARHKKTGACRRLVVTGCLAARYPKELSEELPEVDAFLNLNEIGKIAEVCRDLDSRRDTILEETRYLYDGRAPRLLTTPRYTAYLKISEGCDNPCTFCAIPGMRGRHRSRTIDSVAEEAERLAAGGVRELVLIAQDSTAYGEDLGFPSGRGLARLLAALDRIEGLRWIRVMYAWPYRFTDEVLEAFAELPRVAKYVDMPLQHSDRALLQSMRRGGDAAFFLRLLGKIRARVPQMTLRTTFITGYPGEGEAEFRGLVEFVREARFDRVGVFTYSPEEGTPAFSLGDPVPAEVKEERRAALLEVQNRISLERNLARVGQVLPVLVEGEHPETELLLRGRTEGDAPEIDGSVLLNEGSASPGDIVPVRITEAHAYDLVGSILAPDGEPCAADAAAPR